MRSLYEEMWTNFWCDRRKWWKAPSVIACLRSCKIQSTTVSLPGSVYSDRESSPPTAPATFPSPSVAPVEKPPSASCAWVEPWSRWASGEYGSRGGNSLREEPKKAGPSWDEAGGRLGEYGGRSPTAVLGRLVGMAPWTGFWKQEQSTRTHASQWRGQRYCQGQTGSRRRSCTDSGYTDVLHCARVANMQPSSAHVAHYFRPTSEHSITHITNFVGDAVQQTVQLVLHDAAVAVVHVFGHGDRVLHGRQRLAAGALRQLGARRHHRGWVVADRDGRGQRSRYALCIGQVGWGGRKQVWTLRLRGKLTELGAKTKHVHES